MAEEIKAKINYGKLNQLVKTMSKQYSVRVGLLAGKGGDDEVSPDMDLAGIGLIQEYGSDIKITPKMAAFLAIKAKELGLSKKTTKGDGYVHIPARSWLYTPIAGKQTEFRKKLQKGFGEGYIEKLGEKGDFATIAEAIGVIGLEQIQEAFENSGIDGEWQENSPLTIAGKNSAKPLIGKDGTLREKMTFEVEEKK